ncbi:hypothetical protein [Azospirillum argentinense]|uniref:hypothetical protein n=1 Tax=Azospirillum argentinense TaxID=2970906 RepID=UPI0026D25AFA
MTTPHKKHVAVLMGGWSAEREVSLVSGAGVAKALEEEGYRVTAVDVQRDLEGLLRALTDPRPDAVFNALHGRGGEDGTIQGVLEFLGIPYTHSGVRAAAVAMDKAMTKALLAPVGVRSPKGLVLTKGELTGGAHPMPAPTSSSRWTRARPSGSRWCARGRTARSATPGPSASAPWSRSSSRAAS